MWWWEVYYYLSEGGGLEDVAVVKSDLISQAYVRAKSHNLARGCNLNKEAVTLGSSSGPLKTQQFLVSGNTRGKKSMLISSL